jgi:hypothetical protein
MAFEREEFATAKTESNLSIRGLPHSLHTTVLVAEGTILSKVVPQLRHLYSNSGIHTPMGNSAIPGGIFQSVCPSNLRRDVGSPETAFFLAFFDAGGVKALDSLPVIEYSVARQSCPPY